MRLIDADELKIDYGFTYSDSTPTHEEMYALIDRQKTVESGRKKGQWNFIGGNMFECTCCGTPYTTQQLNGLRNYNTDPYAPKFCPNCGADMREPEDIPMEYFESGGR